MYDRRRFLKAGLGVLGSIAISGCSGLPRIPSSGSWRPPYKKTSVPEVKLIDLPLKEQELLLQRAEMVDSEQALQIYGGLGQFDKMDTIIKKASLDPSTSNEKVIGYMSIKKFYFNMHEERKQTPVGGAPPLATGD